MDKETKGAEDKIPVPTPPQPQTTPKMREIIIHTDGNSIILVKSETAGSLELKAILQALLFEISKK